MKNQFNEMPNWAKGTLAIIGAVVVVYAGWLVKKGVDKIIENRDERKEDKAQEEELENLQQQGIQPTISNATALGLSNTIQTLLDGCELSGSEVEVVNQILATVQNQADWIKLQQTFGTRTIDNCGLGTGETSYDLRSLLTEQIDGFDWSFTLYLTNLKNGLQAKGITF
jgi:predicted GTPase